MSRNLVEEERSFKIIEALRLAVEKKKRSIERNQKELEELEIRYNKAVSRFWMADYLSEQA